MLILLLILLMIISGLAVPLFLPVFSPLKIRNYKGKLIPTGVGAVFAISAAVLNLLAGRGREDNLVFALLILAFAFLGFIDDSLGTGERKGFLGHLGACGLSTGGLKALGGGAFALLVGFLYGQSSGEGILNGLILALAANFLNLLDLRPGRAGKVFLVLAGLFLACKPLKLRPLFYLTAAAAGYLFWDLKEAATMGDAGANALGAALGWAAVVTLPFYFKIITALGLFSLNLASEKVSFSQIIDSNAVLRFLDRLGRLE
ncbi:MAG TPA: UDP-N-acetylmuramyl pentapeptide phosphotransferase [Firmicutes bacterium]|nr:UDP-N-acetylmuramyl pentapeptide phosphotransferase [Bacillota bacterium]